MKKKWYMYPPEWSDAKTLKVMKISFLLLVVCLVNVSARTFSQNMKYNISMRDANVKEVLTRIEKESDVSFFYQDENAVIEKRVTVDYKNSSLTDILDDLLGDIKMTYRIMDKYVAIINKVKDEGQQQDEMVVKGLVVDSQGEPLPGVNVYEKNNPQHGVITGIDGSYIIKVDSQDDILVFSFIGFGDQEINVAGRSQLNITLVEEMKGLDEVVVTALGIKKEKKALGYTMASVSSEELTQNGETNVISGLQGKVSGLNIAKSGGFSDASSSIVLRGNTSINGNNQALIVVDGVILNNSFYGDDEGEIDRGQGISDVNVDDIESVSVLKGPNAAALYGANAANGVIVITTKKSLNKTGLGVTVNTGVSFTEVYTMPNLQNVYGQGKSEVGHWQGIGEDGIPLIGANKDESWGPKMEGQQVRIDWLRDEPLDTYDPQPDNIRDLYETGVNWNTTASISHASEEATYYMSLLYNKGDEFVPTATTEKMGVTMRTTQNITDRLSVDAKLSYSKSKAHNRPENNWTSAMNMATHPRSLKISQYSDYKYGVSGETYDRAAWNDGKPILWTDTPNIAQYFWNLYENSNDDQRDRVLGNFKVDYKFTNWLSALVRFSFDQTYYSKQKIHAPETRAIPQGRYTKDDFNLLNYNSDFLLMANKDFAGGKWNVNGTFGGSQVGVKNKFTNFRGDGFVFEGLLTPNNTAVKNYEYDENRNVVNSLYGNAQLGYNHMLYLDVTGRNDWSSNLSPDNNSFFYPSVTGSFILSEVLSIDKNLLGYAKVRASYAEVGNATGASILRSYGFANGAKGENYAYNPEILPFYDLEPERTKAWEFGVDLAALQNRVSLDVTVYKSNTYNQILPTQPIAVSSGYRFKAINGGNVQNKGVELTLGLDPIKNANFKWHMDVLYAKNTSEVIDLGGLDSPIVIGSMNGNNIRIAVQKGQPFGVIQGEGFLRNDDGMVVVKGKEAGSKRGVPLGTGEYDDLGKIEADWTGSIRNKFTYKNLTLNCLIDASIGGHIFSGVNMQYDEQGTSVASLNGRDAWIASEDARKAAGVGSSDWDNTGGVNIWVGNSVIDNGQRDENGKQIGGTSNAGENALYADPMKYWDQFRNELIENGVEGATYVKMRELSLTYAFGHNILKSLPIEDLRLTVVASNPWLLYKETEHYDPDVYRTGIGAGRQGLMDYTTPSTRTFGFNLKFNF
ncbi:MAG: SusC/RagA family TonB-linked outer membrane protein [Marinilabiliaceae bacterium]|nr:SusC/RagA family TonB-linked outer membrane protein [Marinilabiliaceae bacterium]